MLVSAVHCVGSWRRWCGEAWRLWAEAVVRCWNVLLRRVKLCVACWVSQQKVVAVPAVVGRRWGPRRERGDAPRERCGAEAEGEGGTRGGAEGGGERERGERALAVEPGACVEGGSRGSA